MNINNLIFKNKVTIFLTFYNTITKKSVWHDLTNLFLTQGLSPVNDSRMSIRWQTDKTLVTSMYIFFIWRP